MIVYIAASLRDIDRARLFADRCRKAGHHVTSKWHDDSLTVDPVAHGPRLMLAEQNRAAIDQADVMVLLTSEHMRGALYEAGYADGRGLGLCAVGNRLDYTLMIAGADWERDEDGALDWLGNVGSGLR